MFTIHGMMAIPKEPNLNVVKPGSSSGFFLNFIGVTQGKVTDDVAEFHRWDVMVWVPDAEKDKWETEYIVPGTVLFIETASILSIPQQNGKYHNTKVKLEHTRVKKLVKPLWAKE